MFPETKTKHRQLMVNVGEWISEDMFRQVVYCSAGLGFVGVFGGANDLAQHNIYIGIAVATLAQAM